MSLDYSTSNDSRVMLLELIMMAEAFATTLVLALEYTLRLLLYDRKSFSTLVVIFGSDLLVQECILSRIWSL